MVQFKNTVKIVTYVFTFNWIVLGRVHSAMIGMFWTVFTYSIFEENRKVFFVLFRIR